MKTYHASEDFCTPRENQGQVVTASFSYDVDAQVILVKVEDRSDCSVKYESYAYPEDNDEYWDVYNRLPKLGEYISPCHVEEDED